MLSPKFYESKNGEFFVAILIKTNHEQLNDKCSLETNINKYVDIRASDLKFSNAYP